MSDCELEGRTVTGLTDADQRLLMGLQDERTTEVADAVADLAELLNTCLKEIGKISARVRHLERQAEHDEFVAKRFIFREE